MGAGKARWWRVALGLVVGVLGALALAQPAAAHNSLISSDPKDGARLARTPAQVRLVFLSRLDPASTTVAVTRPDGRTARAGAPRFDGARVMVPLMQGPAGAYAVRYKVVSEDGHPVEGTVRFTVTTPATATATPAPTGRAATASPPATAAVASPPAAAITASPPAAVPAPAASTRDDRTQLWVALVGVGVLAALVAGALAMRRGRRGA
jgi:copper resistance protein C